MISQYNENHTTDGDGFALSAAGFPGQAALNPGSRESRGRAGRCHDGAAAQFAGRVRAEVPNPSLFNFRIRLDGNEQPGEF